MNKFLLSAEELKTEMKFPKSWSSVLNVKYFDFPGLSKTGFFFLCSLSKSALRCTYEKETDFYGVSIIA